MKKTKKFLFLMTIVFVCVFSFVFTGCGATPMNKVQSVRFISEKYEMIWDESVQKNIRCAVFEADLNQEIELKTRITPSSWSGYQVAYTGHMNNTGTNGSRFSRVNNKMTILSNDFEPSVFKVSLDEDKYDFCIVKLKKYPSKIGFLDSEGNVVNENLKIYLPIGGSIKLNPYGVFDGENRAIVEGEYNYEITSDDQTTVKVEDSKIFTISAVKQTIGKTKVVFKLKNLSNELKFKLDIDVFVVEEADASQSFTYIEGTNEFLTNNSSIVIQKEDLAKENKTYFLSYKNYQFSNNENFVFGDQAVLSCNNQYVEIDGQSKIIKVREEALGQELNFVVWCPKGSSNVENNNTNSAYFNSYNFKIKII